MISERRDALVQNATTIIRRRGYAAFSYADLAEVVGIRKASIHHHFPTKEDLGVELVIAYTKRFAARLDDIDAGNDRAAERLDAYAGLYREGVSAGQGCLCGVLASELGALPLRVQAEVRQFFTLNLQWLEKTLRDGQADDLRRDIDPVCDANTVLATLQGAMFVAISLREQAFDQAVEGLLKKIIRQP